MTRSGDAKKDRSIETNVSLWESPYPAMGKQVPPSSSRTEVCAIDAGIAGQTTASLLAKGASVAFTRSRSRSLADKKIRVNAVAPGPIWTLLIPSTFPEEKIDTAAACASS